MSDEIPQVRSHRPRKEWLAVLAVLCIAVFPDLFNAIVAWSSATSQSHWTASSEVNRFWFFHTGLIVRSINVSVAVLVILWLSEVRLESVGIVRVRWWDVPSSVVCFCIGLIGCYGIFMILTQRPLLGLSFQFDPSFHWPHILLVVLSSSMNAFAEEFVVRGFLLTRLERLFESTWLAILLTSFLFASYHIYQGAESAIAIGGMGIAYGAYFCVYRRLWPLVIGHAMILLLGTLATS